MSPLMLRPDQAPQLDADTRQQLHDLVAQACSQPGTAVDLPPRLTAALRAATADAVRPAIEAVRRRELRGVPALGRVQEALR